MLTYFEKNDLVDYPVEMPESWQEAIRMSCQKLMTHNYITDTYVDEIIESIIEHGPYIVIIPNVAMPHAPGNHSSVLKSGISFTKFKKPVLFFDEKEKEEKPAVLFFTIAAKNADEHLENITNLMELFSDEQMMDQLIHSETIEDFDKLLVGNTLI